MANKNTTQIVCVAEFHAFEGKVDALVDALQVLMRPTHQEQGCLRYELNQRIDDPRWVTYIEKWKNRQDFDSHCNGPGIVHYFNVERPELVESYEVKLYHEILP